MIIDVDVSISFVKRIQKTLLTAADRDMIDLIWRSQPVDCNPIDLMTSAVFEQYAGADEAMKVA